MYETLNDWLLSLLETLSLKKPVSRLTSSAVMKIEAVYGQPVSIEEIADSLEVSSRYLRKVFKSEMGLGIHDYLTKLRITRAKELLGGSNLKIHQIASRVGMENPRYFCQFFKKETGVLPSEYAGSKRTV